MKKILLLFSIILLTGCVTITFDESASAEPCQANYDNYCYRYIDYNGEEHYMKYTDGFCGERYGVIYCDYVKDEYKSVKVFEYERVECPIEEGLN